MDLCAPGSASGRSRYSQPDFGCSAEDEDGSAAYTQALLYWITGNTTYAQNAVTILDTYGRNLVDYTNSNAPLQAGWGASKWARAAEIIRYSNAGWPADDAQAFGTMMNNVILPKIINGSGSNGNWELTMIEGMIGIAVYNDDTNLFNQAITFWYQRVPAYFYYFPLDGSNPMPAPRGSPSWYGQAVFNDSVNGIAQETCRDFGHTEYGIAATMAAAESARIQGVDLFGSEKTRLEAGLEFHAHYLLGNPVPSSVCGGSVTLVQYPTFEIGYNHYHNRLGEALPETLNWLNSNIRAKSLPVDHHMMVFETLSHGADADTVTPEPDFSLGATPVRRR
ncbi:MAG TPA: alginate lyase family protein [Candidatus Dormibacteraeota bacterium]|nr:alginate lyase family protein [Candidatus Dormibacteraeota bacterium]